ncbi:hypothetical protein OEA30_003117 [Escherichia coli]|uniref:Uncharacterized protein n=2 Tax=Enterobacteriaceae TaxID=543 RepID=A0A9P2V0Z9_ECOLX|nr:hypothetical protein [Escherichia coli]EHQ2931125.1 hypothetical protein [Escherichia coli O157]EHY1724480.1 hypothetical protein [Escherichia coli O8]EJE8709349.1 hypothetical protein [Shigella sonnei]EJY0125034.1 hypothetical protein [Escherichia coli O116]EJY0134414.1 hypothetical protein [Escherichia coli O76]EJY0164194.1 hypothetical protein [Escherichia coli O9]EJY0204043.1 hypothetical protein [Escherichia coli O113]EJY0209288.1 hypothetical protein [Escherichia coli O96]EKG36927
MVQLVDLARRVSF